MTSGINKKKIVLFTVAGVFFVISGVCQYIDSHLSVFGNYFCSYLADLIFFSLLIAWAISIHIRIVQPSVRRNLILVAVLLILWLLIRMVKYRFIDEQDTVSRYLWYAYYIPQCLVPPVVLLAALGIERKNDKPISRLTYLIFVPAVLLILLIFTNDLHQTAFSFQPGFENFWKDYRHEFGYFLAIAWIVGMTLAGGIVLFIKCSISACRKRKWIPILTFLSCVIVCFICYKFAPAVYKVPELFSFSFIVIFESCIGIGLIPSNENYAEYYNLSKVSSVITDKDLQIAVRSQDAPPITKEQLAEALHDHVMIDDNTRLSSREISGGRVFWTENLSAINELNARLTDVNEVLSEENDLVAYENELKEKKAHIEQKNKLYESILSFVADELSLAESYVGEIDENSPDFEEKMRFVCVLAAYIKRRSNLAVIEERRKTMDVKEIAVSVKESLKYLSDCGVATSLIVAGDGEFPSKRCILLYEFFEECVRRALPTVSGMLVNLSANPERLSLRVAATDASGSVEECIAKIKENSGTVIFEEEDGVIYQTLTFCTGGENQ